MTKRLQICLYALSILVTSQLSCYDQNAKQTVNKSTTDTTTEDESNYINVAQQARQEIIERYDKVLLIDTSFKIENAIYYLKCKYYCQKDIELTIPAKFNPDTKSPFKTHPFASDISLIRNTDTIFEKTVSKSDFEELLDPTILNFGTLLYPNIKLNADTILVNYSISVPGTDLGALYSLQLTTDGKYKATSM